MIGLADCNNFFVSCERSVNPTLEGRAVVVMSNNDGCVVARSNEAKALGIKMGQPVFEIRDLVKSGKVIALSGQHILYRDISLKVHDIFHKFVPHTIDYSIDESFFDMTGIPDTILQTIGEEICNACWVQLRIPVTIGFAQTKTLAKIITDYCKKNKISVGVLNDNNSKWDLLKKIPIAALWGIGRRLSKKLYQSGIFSIADFAERNRYWVRDKLGINGERTWLELHNVDCIELSHADRLIQDTISETRTFPKDIGDHDYIGARIATYSVDCAKKLREMRGACRSISVFLHSNRFHTERGIYRLDNTVRLSHHSDDIQEIATAAKISFDKAFVSGMAYKRAGVILSEIIPYSSFIPSLFDNLNSEDGIAFSRHTSYPQKKNYYVNSSAKPNESLMKIIDKINDLPGSSPLKLASQLTFHTIGHNDGHSSSFQAPSKKK